MEDWGLQIKASVEGVASMLGAGLGVGDALLEAGTYGPHLLAPTATNLDKYGRDGESEFEIDSTSHVITLTPWQSSLASTQISTSSPSTVVLATPVSTSGPATPASASPSSSLQATSSFKPESSSNTSQAA